MKRVIAIDPGTEKSGVVIWDQDHPATGLPNEVFYSGNDIPNGDVFRLIAENACKDYSVAIEWISNMGMVPGSEVFETCLWVGRFLDRCIVAGTGVRLIPRTVVKYHHCGTITAKDANVAASLREKWGEKGTKKDPGFFYGLSGHAWQAAAVAAYVVEGGESARELVYPASDLNC